MLTAPEHTAPHPLPRATSDDTRRAIKGVLDAYGATWHDLVRPDRSARWRPARNALYQMLRGRGWSYSRIGRICRRDHTTVMYSLRKATQWTP